MTAHLRVTIQNHRSARVILDGRELGRDVTTIGPLPIEPGPHQLVVTAAGMVSFHQTIQATGHNVVIFFPTDIPAGPSTTLYVGRVVYTVDAAGVFTLLSTSGRTTDLCVLLA